MWLRLKGPRRKFQMFRWNLDTHEVKAGPRLNGKVFPYKSGISPSGDYIVYFVCDWQTSLRSNDILRTWTALSKVPDFKPLALWEGHGTWTLGGQMLSENHISLSETEPIHPRYPVPKGFKVSYGDADSDDGWSFSKHLKIMLESGEETSLHIKGSSANHVIARRYLYYDYFIVNGLELVPVPEPAVSKSINLAVFSLLRLANSISCHPVRSTKDRTC